MGFWQFFVTHGNNLQKRWQKWELGISIVQKIAEYNPGKAISSFVYDNLVLGLLHCWILNSVVVLLKRNSPKSIFQGIFEQVKVVDKPYFISVL